MSKVNLWLLDHLPGGLLARPAEWFLAVLCAMTGVATLLGVVDQRAVERALPEPIYLLWGVCLVVGAAGFACGLSSIRFSAVGMHVITRVPCYRFGLRLLGTASAVYGGCVVVAPGSNGQAIPLFLFAAMCWIRLLTLDGRS